MPDWIRELVTGEPVRLYGVAVAVLAVISFYWPSLPAALWLALVGAVLGVGEGVRHAVTPNMRVPSVDEAP